MDSTGLQVKTLAELTADLTTAMQTIYGADINIASNSPDGQIINIYAQVAVDQRELLADIYNTFFVENAYGVPLDSLVALNGIARSQATYTTTPVVITSDRALTLTGQDALALDPTALVYTVQDDNKNEYQLVNTYTFSEAGSQTLNFKAVTPGIVEVTVDTITEQVTPILGITAVNNPSTAAVITGLDEETDAQLKIRRAKMFDLAATGPAKSIAAALLELADVTDAYVVENNTTGTVDSVPAHSIRVIVAGGTDAEIGTVIYKKKMPGTGMYGAESYLVADTNITDFTAKWDVAVPQDLYITFGTLARKTGETFDNVAIKAALAASLIYKLGQIATIGDVVLALQAYNPDIIATDLGVSLTAGSYTDTVAVTAVINYFTVSTAHITIT